MLNSTQDFITKLQSFKFKSDNKLVSFDVESLFTNVPLEYTINLICDYIYSDDSINKPNYNKDTFKKLLNLATGGIFMYKDSFYKQIDGITMGSPLGPTFANFFLGHLEKSWLNNDTNCNKPLLYYRYIDDIFCIFDNNDFSNFLDMLNSTHNNIKFTYEVGPKQLSFLDTFITIPLDDNETKCTISVYRKPTFTRLCLNFKAFCPFNWKIGIIYCYLHRAYLCCTNYFLFHKEVTFLENLFADNGYPRYLFHDCVKKFLDKVFSPTVKTIDTTNFITICIPYIGHPSFNLKKKLIKAFHVHLDIKLNCVFTSFKLNNYFSLKSRTPHFLKSKVVYKYTCSCDMNQFYVGKTKRHLKTRVNEHKFKNSPISNHLLICNECSDNYNNNSFKILCTTNSNLDLSIKESIFIKQLNPNLNKQLAYQGSSFYLNVF